MSGEFFKTIDLTSCRRALSELHELVTKGHGRIHVKRRGCDDVCVLISQAELDALERALEILSQTADFQQMCGEITEAAHHTFLATMSSPTV